MSNDYCPGIISAELLYAMANRPGNSLRSTAFIPPDPPDSPGHQQGPKQEKH